MNELLYGHNPQEGIVSVESWGNTIHEFIQGEDGVVRENIIGDYQPWYFGHTEKPNLKGVNFYNTLHRLDQLKDVKFFYEEGFDKRNLLIVGAKGVNYQIDTGKTLFKGMTFDDVHTLGWDIETTGLNSETDTIKMISLVDNRGYSNIIYHDTDEAWIIREFIHEIRRVNPTTMLTYFGYMFDMPFLMRRAELHGIELALGKNGSAPYEGSIQVRLGVGDTEWVKSFRIFGRHNIDLYYTLVKYDFANPVKLNSYGLKNVIAEYGLEKEGRTHMGYEELFAAMESDDPKEIERAKQYCIDDSEDLISLHKYICQADFYLTQIVPMNYDKTMYTGNAGRINALMLRTYLREMTSVPTWHADQHVHIAGAQVEADLAGVFKHIGDSDIKSMYPNLMLEFDIFPENDTLHVMRDTLGDLRDMRYVVKTQATTLEKEGKKQSVEYKFIKGQDLAYKVLINSYFGVLGSKGFHWKNEAKCASVTRHGRNLIMKIKDFIEENGYTVIALDTDGVAYTKGEDFDIEAFNAEIQAMLPGDIEIESSKYKGMVVYKKKTYAVLRDDDSIFYKGAAITSTKMPDLTKRFAFTVTKLLLDIAFNRANYEDIKIYYDNYKKEITDMSLPISAYSMITRINSTISQYKENQLLPNKAGNKRGVLPVYELAMESERAIMMGEKVSTYYAFKEVPKPLSPREIKKKKELEYQVPLFNVEVKPKMVRVKSLQWTDAFDVDNPDIDIEYYINSLNKKVNGLFIEIDDETKVKKYNILSEKQFNNLFSDLHANVNVNQYTYKEFARFIKKIKTFTKWKRITTHEEDSIMLTSGEDLYTSIQRYNSLQSYEGEPIYSPIYFDIDSPDLEISLNDTKCIYNFFTNVLKVEPDYIDIWFSGSKGFHIEINPIIFGIKPMAGLNQILKMIAMDLIDNYKLECIDYKSIYSYRRQWRLPFSINSKTGLRKTFIPDIDEFNDIDDVLDYVKVHQHVKTEYDVYNLHKSTLNPKPSTELVKWFEDYVTKFKLKVTIKLSKKPAWKYKGLKGKFPNCINYILKNSIIRAGDRNVATLSFLSFLKEFGMDKEKAVEIITEWAQNIERGLTSTTEYGKIYMNTMSIANAVYNSNRYVFKCGYIKSIIGNREFSCPSVCALSQF